MKTLKDTIVTPAVTVKWIDIAKPNYKFDKLGTYSVDVKFTEEQANEFRKVLDALHEEAKASVLSEEKNPSKVKQLEKYRDREYFKPDTDKDGDETGDFVLKFKSNAAYIDKKTEETVERRPPAVVDAARNKIENRERVGRGSTVKVAFTVRPYAMSSSKEIGMSLNLAAIQVLELKEFNGSDGTDAFDVEEGFTGSGDDGGAFEGGGEEETASGGSGKGDF